MTEQLIPGAFRVFDTVGNRYVETEGFVLNRFGGLMALKNHPEYPAMVYICSDVADPDCYQVERWTGLYDRDGKPVYEWDAVMADCPWVGDAQGSPKIMFVAYSGAMLGLSLCAWGTFPTDKPHWKEMGWTESSEIRLSFGNKGRLNIPLIGTIHDSPETLAAAAKAVSQ